MAKWSRFAFGWARGLAGFCVWALWLAGCGGRFSARAQDPDVLTLHVYANTIQIPVLVLGDNQKKIAPIAPDRFKVSFDGGPPFRASHVRLEGDDPISLAILLDMSDREFDASTKLEDAIAGLAPLSLRGEDHVSIYGLDCVFARYASDVPAEPSQLKGLMHEAVQAAEDRPQAKHGAHCVSQVHLWDALAFVTDQVSLRPGRRVILVVSDGLDKGSKNKWNEVREFAQASAVAVFGMPYAPWLPESFRPGFRGVGDTSEDAFRSICELSGGVVFPANRRDAANKLQAFVAMVRGRYIVEFPRPRNSTKGRHEFVVSIDKSKAVIHSTGIAVPLPDPKVLADPTTVNPSNGNLAPEEGSRHILDAPR
jgi:hypothetical protein